MREIKFRGLTANGDWVYGDLTNDTPNSTAYYKEYSQRIHWREGKTQCNMPVKNGTVGQFTGILGNNDNEVYEGDVIRYDTEDGIVTAEVIFKESTDEDLWISGFAFRPIKMAEVEDIDNVTELEVIGNIYENSELLNEGGK